MIAYNRQWLDTIQIQSRANRWLKKNLISPEQHTQIHQRYTVGFYTPNTFIRIGLGFFAAILLLALQVFLWLVIGLSMGWQNLESTMGIIYILLSVTCWFILESIIRSRYHYNSGIDDILIYSIFGSLITGICLLASHSKDPLLYLCLMFPFLAAGAIRYTNRELTILAYGCLLAIVLLLVNDIPSISLYLLPFAGIAFSLITYLQVKKHQHTKELRYWQGNFQVLEIISLITFYISGNYLFLQQGAEEIFNLPMVPLSWFFWTFTFAVPIGYIYLGLKKKDRNMLWIGLGCVTFAVFTFRTYFHVMPLPYAATLAGGALFVLSYVSIQYLKKGIKGFTYGPEDTQKPIFAEAEALIVAQTFGHTSTPDQELTFGGGQFGGGGSGGDY